MVDYGENSPDLTWAGSLALGANGVGEEGGSEDWILRRSTNPSTPADVSLPDPASASPLAQAGETIYVDTTGRPQVCHFLPSMFASLVRRLLHSNFEFGVDIEVKFRFTSSC